MTEIRKLEEILKKHTNDPDTLAEFYEARGMKKAGRQKRRETFNQILADGGFRRALTYAQENELLSPAQELDVARKRCESVLEQRPWEALEIARKYNLVELARKAALKRSEDILTHPEHDVIPVLEIARRERAGDEDYRKRTAQHAFAHFIKLRNFSSLPNLVAEFQSFFTEEEKELAEFLAQDAVERDKKRWGELKKAS